MIPVRIDVYHHCSFKDSAVGISRLGVLGIHYDTVVALLRLALTSGTVPGTILFQYHNWYR